MENPIERPIRRYVAAARGLGNVTRAQAERLVQDVVRGRGLATASEVDRLQKQVKDLRRRLTEAEELAERAAAQTGDEGPEGEQAPADRASGDQASGDQASEDGEQTA